MKLNFDILCDRLQESYPLFRYGTATTDLHIVAPRFYMGESFSEYVYLIDTKELPESFGSSAIWICPNDAVPENIDYPLAIVRGEIDAAELMNALLKIFDQFREWDESLRECVEKRLSLRELAGRGAARIGCRILISDKKIMLLADSHFYHVPEDVPFNYQGEILPPNVVRGFSQVAAKHQKLRTPYLLGEDGRFQGHRIYNMNIYFDDRYEGTCSMMEAERKFRDSDFPLFLHFFQYAYKQFQFYYGTLGKQEQAFRNVIKSLIEQKRIDKKTEAMLEPYKEVYHDFHCLVVTGMDGSLPPDEYLCFTIECLFSESVSFVHDNKIIAVIPRFNERDLNALNAVIAPLQLYVGISNRGSRIHEVAALFLQASSALETGIVKKPKKRIHLFEQYILEYLLEHSIGEFTADDFKTEGLRRLESFNKESTVDYLHTLKVYLDQEMNSTAAAKHLYLHRSSFLKRLDRIRQLLGSELETPQGRNLLRWLRQRTW